jgi:hypothetical protein
MYLWYYISPFRCKPFQISLLSAWDTLEQNHRTARGEDTASRQVNNLDNKTWRDLPAEEAEVAWRLHEAEFVRKRLHTQ